jgi:hypothetical protein
MKLILLASLVLIQLSLLAGCSQGSASTPSLAGNRQYPGVMPPPGRIQQNNAISASTMIAPVR